MLRILLQLPRKKNIISLSILLGLFGALVDKKKWIYKNKDIRWQLHLE
jgi:hypothetical protein